LKKLIYWIYVSGIYKDPRPKDQQYFYITFGFLILSLLTEKQCINWLTDRWGCNFKRLQKFIELDIRRTAIEEKWERIPVYNPERYRDHYFYTNFDNLKEKFIDKADHEKTEEEKYQEKHKNEFVGKDFVSYKQAVRIKDMITFTLKLEGRCPDLHMSNESKRLLEIMEKQREDPMQLSSVNYVDYESVPVLKKHKIEMLYKILEDSVERKYKISFSKGMQLVVENLCLFLLMVSVVLKANIFALIYLIFIYKYLMSTGKQTLLVRMATYISLSLFIQYMMFLLNITHEIAPIPFPKGLKDYPMLDGKLPISSDGLKSTIKYPLPLFFHYKIFWDLRLGYLLGIGIDQSQLKNLFIDFFNLFLVSMYILNFRNPVLRKTV
jgi:hypothetical protein